MKPLLTAIALLVSVCSSGQAKLERIVGDFSAISGATGLEVEVTQANENTVWVSASDEKYLPNIQTKVENGVLRLYYDDPKRLFSKEKNKKLRAYVTYKSINRIEVSSGANLVAKNTITGNNFTLDLSSGAQFEGAIHMSSLIIEQTSGAMAKLSGNATEVKGSVSSGGIFNGRDLQTETCKVSAATGGIFRIGVNKTLVASASTGGVVEYKGDPEVKKSVSLGGTVSKN